MSKKSLFVFFLFLFFIIVFVYIFSYFKCTSPVIKDLCEKNAYMLAFRATSDAIKENVLNLGYEDIVDVTKDKDGKILSLTIKNSKINEILGNIQNKIVSNINENQEGKITLPLFAINNHTFFSAYGPKLSIKTIPIGISKVNLKSDFTSAGVNQTKHTLSILVEIDMKVIAPFNTETIKYSNNIEIAETLIMGDVPGLYYKNLVNDE